MLPGPRTRPRRPRRLYMHRAHLRRRKTDSVMVFAVPYVCWTKIELVDLGVLKTSMHANVLARARHGRLDGMLLLLTSLEVRAYPAPRTVRHYRPPLQQKLWRKLNCSWITLQRKTRSTNGGPPFRVSSATPTTTLHDGLASPLPASPPCGRAAALACRPCCSHRLHDRCTADLLGGLYPRGCCAALPGCHHCACKPALNPCWDATILAWPSSSSNHWPPTCF